MLFKKNIDKICKDMQIAGIKEALNNLKQLEEFSRAEMVPILKTLQNILYCYNCIPNKCLNRRIKYLLNNGFNASEIKINIKSLIAEIETMLESTDKSIK